MVVGVMEIKPIAYIHTDFDSKFGVPRQSGVVNGLTGRIVFVPEFRNDDALRGLDGFEYIWLLWDFSEAHRKGWSPTVRPPRLGGNVRMGVFATRSPFRPNSIGLSAVKICGIEHSDTDGPVIVVEGADLMNGTPIYDIKPYLAYTDAHPDAKGGFTLGVAHAVAENLEVLFDCDVKSLLGEEKSESLRQVLAADPRPRYQTDDDRIYGFVFADHEVKFVVRNGKVVVLSCGRAGK